MTDQDDIDNRTPTLPNNAEQPDTTPSTDVQAANSLTELTDPNAYLQRTTFYRSLRSNPGVIEEVDIETGDVFRVHGESLLSTSRSQPLVARAQYREVDIGGGRSLLIDTAVDSGEYVRSKEPPFSWALVDIVCQRIVNGELITHILKDDGMPSYSTWIRWKSEYEGIEGMQKAARAARAEYAHDRILEIAEERPGSMTEASHMKTAIEAYKWSAEKADRGTFGTTSKVEIDQRVATVVRIETGVPDREVATMDESMKLQGKLVTPLLDSASKEEEIDETK